MPSHRSLLASTAGAIVAFGLGIDAWTVRPQPRSARAGFEEGQLGYKTLLANHQEEAVRWLRHATTLKRNRLNSGYAYQRLRNTSTATAAYKEAHKSKPDDPTYAVPIDQ
jgi:hypothetical protein